MMMNGIFGHLLADGAKLFDGDHRKGVDVDREIIDLAPGFAAGELMLAEIDGEGSQMTGADDEGVDPHLLKFSSERAMFGLFHQLEAQFVAAPPGTGVRTIEDGL